MVADLHASHPGRGKSAESAEQVPRAKADEGAEATADGKDGLEAHILAGKIRYNDYKTM